MFQHTAARRRLLDRALISVAKIDVSTHSRPKAAANKRSQSRWGLNSFNTQPPEGGCRRTVLFECVGFEFQHTAARRRLPQIPSYIITDSLFQHTAARRRLPSTCSYCRQFNPFQHTAARRRLQPQSDRLYRVLAVSTHSRPKAAATLNLSWAYCSTLFQHTAARRRLLRVRVS